MLNKTQGIVLHHLKYRETGLIIHMFTRNLGRKSFLIQGLKGKKASAKINYFQPLYMLEIEYYENRKTDIQRIKEVKILLPYTSIPFNIHKSSISIFLAEVLYKTLKTEEPSHSLFDFIQHALQILDITETGFANFHLVFLLDLSNVLGFSPNISRIEKSDYFDLREGVFRNIPPDHPFFLSKETSQIFKQLVRLNYETMGTLKLSREMRIRLLENLLDFYQLHEINLGRIRSFEILKELFDF